MKALALKGRGLGVVLMMLCFIFSTCDSNVFEELPEYDTAMYCHKKMKTNEENSLEVLKEVLPVLEEQEDYTNDPLFETLSAFVKEHGYKNGYVMWPLRTAVSGKQMTPAGATEIMEIIGKDETIKRVKAAIEKLSK